MYKGTSQAETFRERVASDSTKPLAGGRVDVLPPEAAPWEEIYLGLREQLKTATEQLFKYTSQIIGINSRLDELRSGPEYSHAVLLRRNTSEKIGHYQGMVTELRGACAKAAENAFGGCFLEAAKHMLTDEMYSQIESEAKGLVAGREIVAPLPKLIYPDVGTAGAAKRVKQRIQNQRTLALRPTSDRAIKIRAGRSVQRGMSRAIKA